MKTAFDESTVHMDRLGFSCDEDREHYERNKPQINRFISRIESQAKANAKRDYCYVCKKPKSSFCKSHSIPRFALKRIAVDGKVMSPLQGELPLVSDPIGVGSAGTFFLICRDCDSVIFQNYENPDSYVQPPSCKMMAEIAMKNYLQMISKRFCENELYSIIGNRSWNLLDMAEDTRDRNFLDLVEYESGYRYAEKAAKRDGGDEFYLCYYQHLDYVVPYAAQGTLAMICGLDDEVINDIFNMSPDYHLQNIHFMVLPLESSSIVMLFVESRTRRYRKFYRQLRKLSLDEQLSVINYMIFLYSENVFVSKKLEDTVKNNEAFLDVCKTLSNAQAPRYFEDALTAAIREFSLSRRNTIPNFLSKEYSLDS